MLALKIEKKEPVASALSSRPPEKVTEPPKFVSVAVVAETKGAEEVEVVAALVAVESDAEVVDADVELASSDPSSVAVLRMKSTKRQAEYPEKPHSRVGR